MDKRIRRSEVANNPGPLNGSLTFFNDGGQCFAGRFRDCRAGAKDTGGTGGIQFIIILTRNNAAADNDDVVGTELFQLSGQLRHQGFMTGGQTGHADNVHVIFHRHFSRFFRGLEQRTDIDVKAGIGIGTGYHFGTAVVTVLTHFGNEDARATSFLLGKVSDHFLDFVEFFVLITHGCVGS